MKKKIYTRTCKVCGNPYKTSARKSKKCYECCEDRYGKKSTASIPNGEKQ